MKKNLSIVAVATLFFASCAKNYNEVVESVIEPSVDFIASFSDTRTELDGTSVVWNADDELTIFTNTAHNRQYKVKSLSDDGRTATFGFVGFTGTDNTPISTNYAVYPYDANATINGDVIKTTCAAEQIYDADKVDLSCALMAAKSQDNNFAFKNAGALLRFNVSKSAIIPDSYTLNSIKIVSAANNIAGEVAIDTSVDFKAVVASSGSKQIVLSGISKEITTEAQSFYVAVPATSFADKDLTVTFVFGNGQKSFSLPAFDLKQGSIKTIAYEIFEADDFTGSTPDTDDDSESETPEETEANKRIWYAALQKIESSWNYDTFGANIVSHEYNESGHSGNIIFDKEVKAIGDRAFAGCELIAIKIPESVTSIGEGAFYRCNASKITVPKGVKSIGFNAFSWVSEVYLQSTTPPVYGGHDLSVTFYVPNNSKSAYLAAESWKDYADCIVGYDF